MEHVIVNLAKPPSGSLTAFNAYVALPRSCGRSMIGLLHPFDDKLFTIHLSKELRKGDERLAVLGQKAVERYMHSEFGKFGAHHPAAFTLGSNSDFVHSGLARTKVDSDSLGLYTGCVRCINVRILIADCTGLGRW